MNIFWNMNQIISFWWYNFENFICRLANNITYSLISCLLIYLFLFAYLLCTSKGETLFLKSDSEMNIVYSILIISWIIICPMNPPQGFIEMFWKSAVRQGLPILGQILNPGSRVSHSPTFVSNLFCKHHIWSPIISGYPKYFFFPKLFS